MPLKYKKLVVLFSLGIMLIGLGTFSLISPDFHWSFASGSSPNKKPSEASTFGAIQSVDGKTTADIQTELETLVNRYFTAKQQVDMDTIGQCVSDVTHVDEKKLLAESEYVEAYENIQCLVLDGYKKGSYLVYVYYEMKIYDIDTLMPSLNALYITMNENNSFQIYLGTLESEEQKYIDEQHQSKRVKDLIATVQNKLADVTSSDSKARDFYEMLESVD